MADRPISALVTGWMELSFAALGKQDGGPFAHARYCVWAGGPQTAAQSLSPARFMGHVLRSTQDPERGPTGPTPIIALSL